MWPFGFLLFHFSFILFVFLGCSFSIQSQDILYRIAPELPGVIHDLGRSYVPNRYNKVIASVGSGFKEMPLCLILFSWCSFSCSCLCSFSVLFSLSFCWRLCSKYGPLLRQCSTDENKQFCTYLSSCWRVPQLYRTVARRTC